MQNNARYSSGLIVLGLVPADRVVIVRWNNGIAGFEHAAQVYQSSEDNPTKHHIHRRYPGDAALVLEYRRH